MLLKEAVSLIQSDEIIQPEPTVWADLGCGSGLFTRALAGLLAEESIIYAVDKNLSALKIDSVPEKIIIKMRQQNFDEGPLDLANLNGILMANSFHYIRNKISFIKKTLSSFNGKPAFLIVEYDHDTPNPWVPYPLSFLSLKEFFTEQGFKVIKKLNEKKSLYNSGKLYSAFIAL